jgi:GntR family transcriptional regulator of vanillate catabolism
MTDIFSSPDKDTTSDQRVVVQLRQLIMDGTIAAGEKISEVGISDMFGVSRTPARLALRTLEVEGLIRKREGRGFKVLELNFQDVSKAYEVRGILEGLAAGTMARTGMSEDVEARLRSSIERTEAALSSNASVAKRVGAYQTENILFHEEIMNSCGNEFIAFAFARMESLPLVKLGTLVFNSEKPERELMRLRFGAMQHRLIFDAISKRDAQRAEALMREHANQIPVYTSLLA